MPEWCEDLKRRQDEAPKRAQSRGTEDSRTRGTAIEGVDLQAAMQSARAVMQASASPGAIQASSKEIRWISGHQRRSEGTEVRKCLPMGGHCDTSNVLTRRLQAWLDGSTVERENHFLNIEA